MSDIFAYDVFLSFASSDEDVVKPIWQELCSSGLRVFWSDATLKQKLGESWFDTIQASLEQSRHFLMVASQSSIASEWVKREYQAFYNHCYTQGGRRLIPLLVGKCTISQLPIFLRQLQAVELAEPDALKTIVRLFGGNNLEELKANLLEKEQENKILRQEVAQLELSLSSVRRELSQLHQEKTLAKANLSQAGEDIALKNEAPASLEGSSASASLKNKFVGWIRDSRNILNDAEMLDEKQVRAFVAKAIDEVKVQASYGGITDVNSSLIGKKLHDSCHGAEIPVLCSLLAEGLPDWTKRMSAYLLLRFCSCQRNPEELVRQAFETFCITLPSSPDANLAAQAIKQISLPIEEKWGYLINQIDLAITPQGYHLVECLSMFTSPEKRMISGRAISDLLEIASEPPLISACVKALKGLNYRDSLPSIRKIMSLGSSVNKANQLANLLADWRDVKSADLIKEAIERWRFSDEDPHSFCALVQAYYRLGGQNTTRFIAEVFKEAVGRTQNQLFNILYGMIIDRELIDAINYIAHNTADPQTRKTAQEFLSKQATKSS